MKAVGLKATLHSLRHTHASTLIASGLDVRTISRRLGHGSAALTLNVYGHLFKPRSDHGMAVWWRTACGIVRCQSGANFWFWHEC